MMTSRLLVIMVAMSSLFAGCGSMSGLDSSSSFSCKAAPGVTCQSISGVQQNASAGNLPFQRYGDANVAADASTSNATTNTNDAENKPAAYGAVKPEGTGKISPRDMVAASSGMPVRQPPLVLRVWMAPYEDESGDLHDQSYFYAMVHSGRWMIEANRSSISNQFRPIYPLNRQARTEEQAAAKDVQPLVQKGAYENLVEKPVKQ
jgi:conjugal transfer pilus assembly protein TraV